MPHVDYILDGGKTTVGIESTIITFTENGFQILRNGIITKDDIEEIIPFDAASKIEKNVAPGMLKSHYSPKKKLQILNSNFQKIEKDRAGLISFTGKFDADYHKVIRVSEKNDLKDYAVNVFEALHSFEDDDDVDIIYAESVPENGIGKAIMDRLTKAEFNWK